VCAAGNGDRARAGGAIRLRYSAWVLWPSCVLLIVANVFNIGADLGSMANAMQMVTGVRSYYWTPFFALLITGLLIWTSYNLIARVFKWLALVLFAYVITAFLARPDWAAVFHGTFVPLWNGRDPTCPCW
jgi:Mn2+/Fe2+ NRAMP family transporter